MRELLFFLYTVSCYSIFFPLVRDTHLGKTITTYLPLKKIKWEVVEACTTFQKGHQGFGLCREKLLPFSLEGQHGP